MSSSVSISLSSSSNTRSGRSNGMFASAAMVSARWRLVQHRPEHAQILNRLEKGIEVDRLHNECVYAQLVAADEIALFTRRGEHHDRNAAMLRVALDALEDLESID